jgi:hypothetical protein
MSFQRDGCLAIRRTRAIEPPDPILAAIEGHRRDFEELRR